MLWCKSMSNSGLTRCLREMQQRARDGNGLFCRRKGLFGLRGGHDGGKYAKTDHGLSLFLTRVSRALAYKFQRRCRLRWRTGRGSRVRRSFASERDFGSRPDGVGPNAVVPLMLTERGKRANIQNEILDEEHDAAGSGIRVIRAPGERPPPPLAPPLQGGESVRGALVVGRPMTSQMGSDDGALSARLEP
jgi:hypothetical protein